MVKKGIIVFVATLLILFGINAGYNYYQDNVSVMSKKSVAEVNSIEEFSHIINTNEVVYVYMGRPNCGDSDDFEEYFPRMMKEYNVDNLYYFNILGITKEYSEDDEYKTILDSEFGLKYTPTLAKFENGKLVLKSEWTPSTGYNEKMAEEFIKDSGLGD